MFILKMLYSFFLKICLVYLCVCASGMHLVPAEPEDGVRYCVTGIRGREAVGGATE